MAAVEDDTEIVSFTLDQVLSLTGITRRRLTYWIDTGVIQPQVESRGRRGNVRLFSFADLLEVRIAVWLRDVISLQFIRRIVERLREEESTRGPLASVRFGVFEYRTEARRLRLVMQRHDGQWEDPGRPGQLVLTLDLPLADLKQELHSKIERRRTRRGYVGKVERRRGVMGSTPVVAGTRVPTAALRRLRESGYSVNAILKSYPGLKRADVLAALEDERRRREPA